MEQLLIGAIGEQQPPILSENTHPIAHRIKNDRDEILPIWASAGALCSIHAYPRNAISNSAGDVFVTSDTTRNLEGFPKQWPNNLRCRSRILGASPENIPIKYID